MDNSERLRTISKRIENVSKTIKALLSKDSAFLHSKEYINLLVYLSYLAYELGRGFRLDASDEDIEWITVNGNRIPVDKKTKKPVGGQLKAVGAGGGSVKDAMSRAVKPGTKLPLWFERNAKYFNIAPRPYDTISSQGENDITNGFRPENLDAHWYGSSTCHSHKDSFNGITKEEYGKQAKQLLAKPCGRTIAGYKRDSGEIVRYDRIKGELVIGHPDLGITTFFKPGWNSRKKVNDLSVAQSYFDRLRSKEEGK